MPGHDKHPTDHHVDDDYVPPRDKAEMIEREYEERHHERAGTKKEKETPSHDIKPKSVRQ